MHSQHIGPRGVNDECFTPPDIFATLALRFTVDVCAPEGGVPWLPADRHYSKADDGLAQSWHGTVWMNPPYSKPLPWVEKFVAHGDGVALVPTSNGRWMRLLWEAPTTWIMAPPIRFVRPDGTQYKGTLPTVLWLVGIGDKGRQAVARFGAPKS